MADEREERGGRFARERDDDAGGYKRHRSPSPRGGGYDRYDDRQGHDRRYRGGGHDGRKRGRSDGRHGGYGGAPGGGYGGGYGLPPPPGFNSMPPPPPSAVMGDAMMGAPGGVGGAPFTQDHQLFSGGVVSQQHYGRMFGLRGPELDEAFEAYRSEYVRRNGRKFYEEHKDEEWFRERYDPETLEAKRAARKAAAAEAARDFHKQLAAGTADVSFDYCPDAGEADAALIAEKAQRSKATVFAKNVPCACERETLVKHFGAQPGYVSLRLSEPSRRDLLRYCWVQFETPEQCEAAIEALKETKLEDASEAILPLSLSRPEELKINHTNALANTDERLRHDLKQAVELTRQLDAVQSIGENALVDAGAALGDDASTEAVKAALDRLIAYLRAVHFFCYYSGEEGEDEWHVVRRCGVVYRRGAPEEEQKPEEGKTLPPPSASASAWATALDRRLAKRLEEAKKANEPTSEPEISTEMPESWFEDNMRQESEEKYRCKICQKAFKAPNFVRKHLNLKHDERTEEEKEAARTAKLAELKANEMFENYVQDRKRVMPITERPAQPRQPQKQPRQEPRAPRGPRPMAYQPMQATERNMGRLGPTEEELAFKDPRGMRQYLDLDAPPDDSKTIEYRSAVNYGDL